MPHAMDIYKGYLDRQTRGSRTGVFMSIVCNSDKEIEIRERPDGQGGDILRDSAQHGKPMARHGDRNIAEM